MKKFITFIIAVMISVADIAILQKNYSDKLTLAFIGVSLAVLFAEAVFCRSRLHCISICINYIRIIRMPVKIVMWILPNT